ncbi:hypothetical protein [Plantactinospora mayteni]|uniref:hypothetical protein n=1 Tax=Plantactinospora mayteni TaxID=566021 RepID=UPI0019417C56|nr:hypothetical protein [Plantactinospora mayteni]
MSGRHVIHLPVVVPDIEAAADLAACLADSLAFLGLCDAGEITVSAEDAQDVRHRVFCDRLLPAGGRCGARDSHPGACHRNTDP